MFGSQIFHFVFGVILNPFFGGTVVFTIEVNKYILLPLWVMPPHTAWRICPSRPLPPFHDAEEVIFKHQRVTGHYVKKLGDRICVYLDEGLPTSGLSRRSFYVNLSLLLCENFFHLDKDLFNLDLDEDLSTSMRICQPQIGFGHLMGHDVE